MGRKLDADGRYLIIGREIRRLRLEQGLSQSELSRRVGCLQPVITDVERGMKNPLSYLDRIAAYFGMVASDFTSLVETCPHCGGTGVQDNDPRSDALRRALNHSRRA